MDAGTDPAEPTSIPANKSWTFSFWVANSITFGCYREEA